MKNLVLKSIPELFEYEFYIPAYQRGYRWDEQQVIDLLKDINDFAQKKERQELAPGEFYCLQPIVVKQEQNKFRVIDGQQRLTTLFILLKIFQSKIKEDYYIDDIYRITFETRENNIINIWEDDTEKFEQEGDETQNNIDNYYIKQTYNIIKKWFHKNEINKSDFLNVILKKNKIDDDKINNLRFIWYQINDNDEDEIDIFTRLNIGKIPLTNGELIKALFLINIKEEQYKILLTTEWDLIENNLSEEEFYYFISNKKEKNSQSTRIDFIFDLMLSLDDSYKDPTQNNDERKSYYYINEKIKKLNQQHEVSKLWHEVKYYYRILKEIYEDNKSFHKVGFLIAQDYPIKDIVKEYSRLNKDTFQLGLDQQIRNQFKGQKDKLSKDEISQLTYLDDKKLIQKLLFLFNVIITMDAKYSGYRYPFNLHKSEIWSIEHIHAQNSEFIKDEKERIALIDLLMKKYNGLISDDPSKIELEKIFDNANNAKKIEDKEFDKFMNLFFGENDEYIHGISNLALLSRSHNSKLNNNIFAIKVDMIKELELNGAFIPMGTKNLFLKYFNVGAGNNSPDSKNNYIWDQEDRKNYIEKIKSVLEPYL